MADFTKIDQRVDAALFAEDPSFKQGLAESAPSEMQLNLEPCGSVIEQVAQAAFGAAVQAASEDPELATDKKLRLYLQVELRPHLVEALIGERDRSAVLDLTRGKRNQVLSDHSLTRASNGELFVVGPDTDSREVAPAAVQVPYEPFGLYERIAPRSCRYVMRGDADTARKILEQLYDGAVERFFARRLAAGSGLQRAIRGAGQSTKLEPTDSAGRGRPREDDLRQGITAALRMLPPGSWLKHRDELATELIRTNVRYKHYRNADDGVICKSWKELAQLYPGVFDERIRPHAARKRANIV